jgi:DNA-binding winged helix-turn-helix (wHTH) protein
MTWSSTIHAPGPAPRAPYDFGPFRLDPAESTLLRDGVAIPLTPKAFDTLEVLVEQAGRLVSRDELMRRVWPGTFVAPGNLAVTIHQLRRALGERADGRPYIETVPRRGYRFAAEVRTDGLTGPQPARTPECPPIPPSRWTPARIALVVALSALLGSLLAVAAMRGW